MSKFTKTVLAKPNLGKRFIDNFGSVCLTNLTIIATFLATPWLGLKAMGPMNSLNARATVDLSGK